MQASQITTAHAVKGMGNVTRVRKWVLLTEVTFASGTVKTYNPCESVRLTPRRDANGRFTPKTWLVMLWSTFTGDVVVTANNRREARNMSKLHKLIHGGMSAMVAL